ncbi:cathepsin S-like [Mixophyes fleayi]|uniref:cathepsin S-like n=1 Tax=Mixophyes fleayi TaxID=3061075 RepID=UPI003F4DA1A4
MLSYRMRLHQVLPIFCILVMCTWASHYFDQEWNIWKSKYGKTYVTVDEELLRRKTWEDTWYKVQKHNELADQGLTSYRMAMNHFADMTGKELESRSCLISTGFPSNAPTNRYRTHANLPEHFDWRDSKCLTEVKNQGSYCGSCWAFATVGVIESRLCIKNHELMDLSEQQLVDCDTQDSGCCGGLPILALMYVADQGVMKTEDYAYTGKKMACSYNSDEAILLNTTKYYLLSGEENLASSVALEGPITTGFGVSSDFLLYSEGIYDGDCSKNPNHAIIIVGYGTEQEEENKAYWIIKNSWGEEWGEIGYGKIERNINKCYIAEFAATIDIM